MAEGTALSVASAYHRCWTEGDVDNAARYLDDGLSVEVPVNSYPTKAAFVTALGFTRRMTSKIEVLSKLGGDGEAMILYDMSLPFGLMRVAEHFSVSRGKITRIRQVHDTHALRAAGVSPS